MKKKFKYAEIKKNRIIILKVIIELLIKEEKNNKVV